MLKYKSIEYHKESKKLGWKKNCGYCKVCPIVIKVLLHMFDKLHYPSRAHIHEGIEYQNKVLDRCLKQPFSTTSNA